MPITEIILRSWNDGSVTKRRKIFRSWIRPGNALLVALEGDSILAVGCVTNSGEITLNYVSPDARFRGASKALLRAIESRAIEQGNERCTLRNTETARRFYLAGGFAQDGPAEGKFGMGSGYPMSKRLIAEGSGRAGK